MTNTELQNARHKLDMTQRELAIELGIDRVTLARYEIDMHRTPKAIGLAVRYLLLQRSKKVTESRRRGKK